MCGMKNLMLVASRWFRWIDRGRGQHRGEGGGEEQADGNLFTRTGESLTQGAR